MKTPLLTLYEFDHDEGMGMKLTCDAACNPSVGDTMIVGVESDNRGYRGIHLGVRDARVLARMLLSWAADKTERLQMTHTMQEK